MSGCERFALDAGVEIMMIGQALPPYETPQWKGSIERIYAQRGDDD
jgi:hypothetical protein